jgi:hypothetical protein
MVLALSYNEDNKYSNTFYCDLIGITAEEFSDLEMALLDLLEFKLFVTDDNFEKNLKFMESFSTIE